MLEVGVWMFYQYLFLMWGINVLVDSDAFFSYKFENWIYKIENKEFELENLIVVTKMSQLEIVKFELLNIKILKNWKIENWNLFVKCLEEIWNFENWNVSILKIEN